MPRESIVPVEPFSVTTSAVADELVEEARPSSDFRLMPRPRFEREDDAKEPLICVPITMRMKSG